MQSPGLTTKTERQEEGEEEWFRNTEQQPRANPNRKCALDDSGVPVYIYGLQLMCHSILGVQGCKRTPVHCAQCCYVSKIALKGKSS